MRETDSRVGESGEQGPGEVITLDFPEMEGHCYDRSWDGERDNYQIDYRRIVGDTEPARPRLPPRDGDQQALPYGPYTQTSPHSIGHETAAQRYSATRIQAGYEPERSVGSLSPASRPATWSQSREAERPILC